MNNNTGGVGVYGGSSCSGGVVYVIYSIYGWGNIYG